MSKFLKRRIIRSRQNSEWYTITKQPKETEEEKEKKLPTSLPPKPID